MTSDLEIPPNSEAEALALAGETDTRGLMRRAAALRDRQYGRTITYSRKAFIPLTHLCRDSCHYCTFVRAPRKGEAAYMSPQDVLAVVRKGEAAGCTEALFTLGDKAELRYRQAQDALRALGCATTLEYLRDMAALALKNSSLLPHLNPGAMTAADLAMLRPVAASMGLMLEQTARRLTARGGVHFGSPDKPAAVRLATIRAAGEFGIPFTSGLLIGIGETRRERIEALFALRALHAAYGHLQEIIIQPFRAKADTRMAAAPDATDEELLWTIAVARLVLGGQMSIQTPPNLAGGLIDDLIEAGINDWGGISPVTVDFVNPEAPWPQVDALAARMRAAGRVLAPRLPLYPRYVSDLERWADPGLHRAILIASDSEGLARDCGHGTGTNAVRLAPRCRLQFQFGDDSYCRHQMEARRHGIVPFLHFNARIAGDIDMPADLAVLEDVAGCDAGSWLPARELS